MRPAMDGSPRIPGMVWRRLLGVAIALGAALLLAPACRQIVGIEDRPAPPHCAGVGFPEGTCAECMAASCCEPALACASDAACGVRFACLAACDGGDEACRAACEAEPLT